MWEMTTNTILISKKNLPLFLLLQTAFLNILKANQREESYKEQIKTLTSKLKQVERERN